MSETDRLEYYDRREGRVKSDAVPAARLTHWIHNTRLGRWVGEVLFAGAAASHLYGRFQKSRLSRRRIGPFMRTYGVDRADLAKPAREYASLRDFFIRDIDPARRPFVSGSEACAAPADGRILAYPDLPADRIFPVKRALFNLRDFLRDDRLAEDFAGGTLVVSRLGMGDYHYVHFPCSGIPAPAISLPGKYRPSGPYSLKRTVPYFRENHRMITLFETERFGRAAIIEVGAFAVGSIRQVFRPGVPAAKGDKKARFEPGGSTVALLFRKGTIEVDADLLARTADGMETYVRLGESIGRAAAASNPRPAPWLAPAESGESLLPAGNKHADISRPGESGS